MFVCLDMVTVKKLVTDESSRQVRLVVPTDGFPEEIKPEGLSKERQAYLYQEIREFCAPGTENLVCPKPPSSEL